MDKTIKLCRDDALFRPKLRNELTFYHIHWIGFDSVREWSKWAVLSPAVPCNAGLCCRSPAVWSRLSWAVQESGTDSSVTSPPANRSRYTEESPEWQVQKTHGQTEQMEGREHLHIIYLTNRRLRKYRGLIPQTCDKIGCSVFFFSKSKRRL